MFEYQSFLFASKSIPRDVQIILYLMVVFYRCTVGNVKNRIITENDRDWSKDYLFAKCQKTIRFLSMLWPEMQIWPKQNEDCYADFRFFTIASVKMPQKRCMQVITNYAIFFCFSSFARIFFAIKLLQTFFHLYQKFESAKVFYTKFKFFEGNYWVF